MGKAATAKKPTKRVGAIKSKKSSSDPKKVTQEDIEKLKGFDTLVRSKREQLGELVEKMFLAVDQISYIRTMRAGFVNDLAKSHNIPDDTKWGIDPNTGDIVFREEGQ